MVGVVSFSTIHRQSSARFSHHRSDFFCISSPDRADLSAGDRHLWGRLEWALFVLFVLLLFVSPFVISLPLSPLKMLVIFFFVSVFIPIYMHYASRN
ncbi:hypothetical protein Nepgr_026876 [Nepenthes gracilis]|uniref:Uncharacterized protein n=1 Tax=Nepenthes gracilis TaxID=150966 RepID=A0AAD3Y0Y8_NEPGR|nr:hypothetical protein Nepgr_026876 [Nepenthes gracilis]